MMSKVKFFQTVLGIVIVAATLPVAASFFLRHASAIEASSKLSAVDSVNQTLDIVTVSQPPAVETIKVVSGTKTLKVTAFGKTQPNRALTVQSEVKGRVIEISPNLEVGATLKEAEIMLKLDPTDYLNEVEQSRVKVEKAEFELIVERGRKHIAEKEWELLSPSFKEGGFGKDLALRIPHLREKEASLLGAQSALEKSLADLKRTVIRAPFNAIVLEEFVEMGQLVGALKDLAKIVSTDEFRVLVSIPYAQLSWVHAPEKTGDKGTSVDIVQELGDQKHVVRKGYVLRILGGVDPNSRLVQLLVGIDDPLNLRHSDSTTPPLLLGTHVEVIFEGPQIENAVEIPRLAIREGNKVWIATPAGKLEVRKVHIVSSDKYNVIIDKGLTSGEAVIVSELTEAHPGMVVREIPAGQETPHS